MRDISDFDEIHWQDPVTGQFLMIDRERAAKRDEQEAYSRWLVAIIKSNPAAIREALGLISDEEGFYHVPER